MNRRKWLWAIVPVILLAAWIAVVSKPTDELAAMMKLHPHTMKFASLSPVDIYTPAATEHRGMGYLFDAPGSIVDAAIPGRRGPAHLLGAGIQFRDIYLPSGRYGWIEILTPPTGSAACSVFIENDNRPWYVRAWSSIKSRIGL